MSPSMLPHRACAACGSSLSKTAGISPRLWNHCSNEWAWSSSGAAATARDAERFAHEHGPKVAVVDIKLRDGMAYGLIDRLYHLGVPVVVVTGFGTFSMP